MTTLSKRATPAQKLVLRMVEGAVKNVAHFHPEWGLSDKVARSIAKRAAGTLTAQWPDVLAAKSLALSDRAGEENCGSTRPLFAQSYLRTKRGALGLRPKRPPLFWIRRQLGIMAGEARHAGNQERLNGLADALRVIEIMSRKKRHD